MLKLGGYRSAAVYLSAYKVASERLGYVLGGSEIRAIRDATRACERGQGPAKQALPLPFEKLGQLRGDRQSWCKVGPLSPRNAIIAGAWFLCREVELSCTRAALL